jgi:hypothetical protein
MSEKYPGLVRDGVRPSSGRPQGQLSKSTYCLLALRKLESVINDPKAPIGVVVLAAGLYLLVTK